MARLVKTLFFLAFLGIVLLGGSYAAARFTAGRLVGPKPKELGRRSIRLVYRGVPALPGKPVAWEFTYAPTALPGARRVLIYVSLTGRLIATRPPDLDLRLEALRRAQEP